MRIAAGICSIYERTKEIGVLKSVGWKSKNILIMIMGSKKEYDLIEAIEAVGAEVAPDLDIVDVRIVGASQSPIVRVYIDHPDGVTFDVLTSTQK